MAENKVSVIIPIYKVERFIERCVVSLMEQTLDEVEYIFVDDASPDGSVNILREVVERYPSRRECVKIVTHSENKGLPAARNTGLAEANGEYIYHCDSDDFVELDMLEVLYNKAKECDADVVWCDFKMVYADREEYNTMFYPHKKNIESLKAYLSYGWNVVWNMIVKRSIYNDHKIKSFEGLNFTEDYGLTSRLIYNSKVIEYVPKALYNYNRENLSSIVHQELDELKKLKMAQDEISICCLINDYFCQKNMYKVLEKELSWRVLKAKRYWLYCPHKWKDYLSLCPESNKYISSNPFCSKKDKICQNLILHFWGRPLLYVVKMIDKIYKNIK